jgi:hypothetical protein
MIDLGANPRSPNSIKCDVAHRRFVIFVIRDDWVGGVASAWMSFDVKNRDFGRGVCELRACKVTHIIFLSPRSVDSSRLFKLRSNL